MQTDSPPMKYGLVSVFDPRWSEVVVFGGCDNRSFEYNDTWILSLSQPTGVSMSNLSTRQVPRGVEVSWDAIDGAFLGFRVLRASHASAPDTSLRILNPDMLVPAAGPLLFLDTDVEPGESYSYVVIGVLTSGDTERIGPVAATAPGVRGIHNVRLQSNPTDSGVALLFELARAAAVQLEVYDLLGRRVRSIRETLSPGQQAVFWDGCNDQGHPAASGVYMIRLGQHGHWVSRRVTLVR